MRDQGYLASLNRPNVQLTFEHIARVEPDGIVTEAGTYVLYSRVGSVTILIVSRREGSR